MRSLRIALLAFLVATAGLAGTKRLTIDDIYEPKKLASIVTAVQSGFVWIDDTHFFFPRKAANGDLAMILVDALTGKEIAVFDAEDLQAQVSKLGISDDDAKRLAHPKAPNFNPKNNAILLEVSGDLYIYTISSKRLTRLTTHAGEEEEASFSPDGASVAFVRSGNLFVIPAAGGAERQLTTSGNDHVLNGKLDWVYQEEIYGRGIFKGYWWSPDSRAIAYLQLDEKPVPEFTVVDHIPYAQKVEVTNYPKAGDPNPKVSLLVTNVDGATTTEISQADYKDVDLLVVEVAWTPDGKRIVAELQDREQTWLDLVYGDPATGLVTPILREKTPAWVERTPAPQWLADGSFLWLSERDGYSHIYRVSPDGQKQTQLTRGAWEVRDLHGVDVKTQRIYFSGTAQSSIELHLYRMSLDGSRMEKITTTPGTHTVAFSPKMTLYIDTASDITTPPRVSLYRETGRLVRVIDQPPNTLSELALSTPEILEVKTRDGFVMNAILIKPVGFDFSNKYPVYEHTYSGPHAPQVKNSWGGPTYLFHQLLAQQGIAVWICDNRTASGKGAASAWPLYKNFGELELRDLEDGLQWLGQRPWVDSSRVLINGWSFGGFMVSYALTHSHSFRAGIAGGSVTDWKNYDSVYTERYMLTPEHNKEGYEKSSPRHAAAALHGNLLLLHGAIDDNVHVQNTIQFAYDLQKAGRKFEMMVYPKSRHGVIDPPLVKHMRQVMLDFILRNLK